MLDWHRRQERLLPLKITRCKESENFRNERHYHETETGIEVRTTLEVCRSASGITAELLNALVRANPCRLEKLGKHSSIVARWDWCSLRNGNRRHDRTVKRAIRRHSMRVTTCRPGQYASQTTSHTISGWWVVTKGCLPIWASRLIGTFL